MTDYTAVKAELEQTTISGRTWVQRGRPAGHWANAWAMMEDVAPPTATYPLAPQPPFDVQTTPLFFREQGREIGHVRVHDTIGEGISILGGGVVNGQWTPKPTVGRFDVHDTIVENTANKPGEGAGTTGFNYRIGQSCDAARLVGRNPYWCNVWLSGAAWDCKLTDLDMEALGPIPDPSHPGKPSVYIEHGCRNPTLTSSKFKATGHTIIGEWWHRLEPWYVPFMPAETQKLYPGRSGSFGGRFDDLTLISEKGSGIMLGPGYFGAKIATLGKIKFVGCPEGAIQLPRLLADPSQPNEVNLANCDFSECVGPSVVYHDMPIG